MTTQHDFKKYHHLKDKLEREIASAQNPVSQGNYNTSRHDKMKRLYDRCFPRKEWVIAEVESFYQEEEEPRY